MAEVDPAILQQLQRDLRDLTARLERGRVVAAKPRKPSKKGRRVVRSLPTPPGPEPTDLDVQRALRILRRNGWHDHG
jgi:hypothetical protein